MPFSYSEAGATAIIDGWVGGDIPTELSIPGTIDGYDVVGIAEGAFSGHAITSLTLPSSLTTVGANAFASCTSLTTLTFTLPSSLTTVGNNAFAGCTSLTSVTLPSSLTTLGDYAFLACTDLATLTFTLPSSLTTLGNQTFSGCTSLTTLTLPSSLTTVGTNTFNECTSLTSVTLPSSLTAVGNNTFADCTNLVTLTFTLPSSLTTVGNNTFSNCASLTTLTLPSSLTTVGDYTFSSCASLTTLTFPSSLTTVGDYTFSACVLLTTLTFPSSLTTVGDYGFYACTSVISIEFLGPLPTIGSNAFNNLTSLTTVTVPPSWPSGYTIGGVTVTRNGGGGVGDPYVTTIHGHRYKLPIADMPVRFYQGMVDGTLLTVNAQLRTTDNADLFAENMRSYLAHKDSMPKNKLKELEFSLYSTEKLCFFEKFYIQYGDSEITLNVWDHKFKFESYKGKIASESIDGRGLTNTYSDIYKNYESQTLKFSIGKSASVFVSVYPGTMLKNGIFIEAPELSKGNGVLVNVLNTSQMALRTLKSLDPVAKKDSKLKEREEWFLDHDGYRTRNILYA